MNKIIEAANLPEGEKVYLKKDWLGWRVVEPPTKWYHYVFGSKKTIIMLIGLLLLAGMFYFGINEVISGYKDIAANPCNYCKVCAEDNMKIEYVDLYYDIDNPNETLIKNSSGAFEPID